MARSQWCKLHRVAFHDKCDVCFPPPPVIIGDPVIRADVFTSRTPDYSNLPSIESVMLIPKIEWGEKQWLTWRVWNASKNKQ